MALLDSNRLYPSHWRYWQLLSQCGRGLVMEVRGTLSMTLKSSVWLTPNHSPRRTPTFLPTPQTQSGGQNLLVPVGKNSCYQEHPCLHVQSWV